MTTPQMESSDVAIVLSIMLIRPDLGSNWMTKYLVGQVYIIAVNITTTSIGDPVLATVGSLWPYVYFRSVSHWFTWGGHHLLLKKEHSYQIRGITRGEEHHRWGNIAGGVGREHYSGDGRKISDSAGEPQVDYFREQMSVCMYKEGDTYSRGLGR